MILLRNPEFAVVSHDDAGCKLLLASLGILERFVRSSTPNFCVITSGEHPTHYVIGALWTGHPEGNGYSVFCLPKGHTSPQELSAIVDWMMRTNGSEIDEKRIALVRDDWRKQN
jgi:hypothetical protein